MFETTFFANEGIESNVLVSKPSHWFLASAGLPILSNIKGTIYQSPEHIVYILRLNIMKDDGVGEVNGVTKETLRNK